MLEQNIKKNLNHLYDRINEGIDDDTRIGHLQVIL
jgi:hypothetical protein